EIYLTNVLHKVDEDSSTIIKYAIICATKANPTDRPIPVKLITMSNNKQYLLKEGFTYYKKRNSKTGYTWWCTARCNSYLNTYFDLEVLTVVGTHNHRPSVFHELKNGTYVKYNR
ncbi:unnamed protein product, partial [Plutella xylostella]